LEHPVDTVLDLSVEEDLKTEFNMQGMINNNEAAVAQILKHPLCLVGASDGGTHTKFLTLGRSPTHFLAHWVRDKQVMTLEEAHWRLSTMIGWAIGIRDRAWLREGMLADIVVYDLENLKVKPMETVRDLPDGDWRRVHKADGYRYITSTVKITFQEPPAYESGKARTETMERTSVSMPGNIKAANYKTLDSSPLSEFLVATSRLERCSRASSCPALNAASPLLERHLTTLI
jgi:hypothetical protein